MKWNNKQFVAYGSKKNIFDYIKIHYTDYYISIDSQLGEILPNKTAYIFTKYQKNLQYPVVFFLENVPGALYITDQLLLKECCDYFNVTLTQQEENLIYSFTYLESVFFLIFKYKICNLPLHNLLNTVDPNPIQFIFSKRFKLKNFHRECKKVDNSYKEIIDYYLTKMEHNFLETGNKLVIDFIRHMEELCNKENK